MQPQPDVESDIHDSYLLRVRTLFVSFQISFKNQEKTKAFLLYRSSYCLCFFTSRHCLSYFCPTSSSCLLYGITNSLERNYQNHGTILGIPIHSLSIGNDELEIASNICVKVPRTEKEFTTDLVFNRHLFKRGEVRTVKAGKCRNYQHATGSLCLNKGFIYQVCDIKEFDGEREEQCLDGINHRKLSRDEKSLDPVTYCTQHQVTRFEAKAREEGQVVAKPVVIDRYRGIYYREEKGWGFIVVKGDQYNRKIEEFTCDISRDEGRKYQWFYEALFVQGGSAITEFDEELQCDVYTNESLFDSTTVCIDKNGFVKRYCTKSKKCTMFTEHKVVDADDERFTIKNVCTMPEQMNCSVVNSLLSL
ncbi:hypothetical protein RCL1_000036 [Eukaryota sp. TZLM3-RCL]